MFLVGGPILSAVEGGGGGGSEVGDAAIEGGGAPELAADDATPDGADSTVGRSVVSDPSVLPASLPSLETNRVSPTTGVESGSALVASLLSMLLVEPEFAEPYDRELFGNWLDEDNDGCDTRQQVLLDEAIASVGVEHPGCAVVGGSWFSSYDAVTLPSPALVEIDHVVALKEAWDSGALRWSEDLRKGFANDLRDARTLRAASVEANQVKGDSDPAEWLPSEQAAVCPFVADWVAVKARWSLSVDEAEFAQLSELLNNACLGLTTGTVSSVPGAVLARSEGDTSVRPFVPLPGSDNEPASSMPVADNSVSEVYFRNCSAARSAGAAPLYVGDPGYRSKLDRDGDGVACE